MLEKVNHIPRYDSGNDMFFRDIRPTFGHDLPVIFCGVNDFKTEMIAGRDAPRRVILDWMMSDMDGLQVLQLASPAPATDRPPYFSMLTSKGEKDDVIAWFDTEANYYLAKPF